MQSTPNQNSIPTPGDAADRYVALGQLFASFLEQGRRIYEGTPPGTPGGPPLLIGGSSKAALKRAARLGDGWFGHWTDAHDPTAEMEQLQQALGEAGRNADDGFLVKASLVHSGEPDSLNAALDQARELGVAERVLIVPVRTRTLEADLRLWAEAAGLAAV